MPGAVLGSNRKNDMTNLKTTIVGQFSVLETLADDKQEHIISAVLGEDAEVIELSFDPVRPESPVFYRYPDVSEDWQSCPFQSADVRHLSDEAACAMVNNWVG